MSPGPDDDAAAGAAAPGGGVTGRVQVGRFALEIGAPAGTHAVFTPASAAAAPAGLAVALSRAEEPEDAVGELEQAVGEAESVTGRVEHALELFTALAQGRILDRRFLLGEVDALLGVLERLDREGRYRDALRLARALAALLALAMRWVALVETFRIALRAARALGDARALAWVKHELGTLALGAEDAAAATRRLDEALRLREELGDEAGAAVTRHNLAELRRAFGPSGRGRADDGGLPKPLVVALVVAAVLLVAAGGAALAVALLGDDETPGVDTVAPEVEVVAAPDDPTDERSASFAFTADEEVRTFECRLDGGAFAECVSPENVEGPLDLGEHVFAVRAVDFAGNVGAATVHTWTIERGVGPPAVISDGPDELTNQTAASFEIQAPGAVRLECRVDDGDFAECSNLVGVEVDEGEHTFAVRAFDAADNPGPPARYRWTVDTTPPQVTIDSVELVDPPLTVEVVFTPRESGSTIECTLLRAAEPEPRQVEIDPDCASPKLFEDLDSGVEYIVRVTATDAARNVGDPAEEEFDTIPDVE